MATSKKGCNRDSEKHIDGNKDVDLELWHALAGRMVQIPQVNSNIFYFPQGHAEHAYQPVHFPADFKIPSRIPCRVAAIHYRADPDTYEVYAKLRLVPLHSNEVSNDDDGVTRIDDISEANNKYTKTLTQTDAKIGVGFSCPKNCAETLFPPLDYSGTPPSQNIYPMDVHGEMWEFKHVYRGSSKRHVLTTGWSDFVIDKRLVSGDLVVFVRAENGDLHIGIRRSKRQNDKHQKNDKGNELRIGDKVMGIGKVKAADVIEAVKLAVNMQPFDVAYYPRVGTPEYFVKTSLIETTLQTEWYVGMRFKMAIESEDSSCTIWFYGTIASVQDADPAWPDSLWRLLQVTWDEPDLVKNPKRVNPWQVEIVLIPFSSNLPPSRKKLRLLEHQAFPTDGQFSMETFPNYNQTPNVPMFHFPETSPAGMQGARHDPFGISLSDLHINKSPLGLFKPNFQQPLDHNSTTSMTVPSNTVLQKANDSENVPCSPSEKEDHPKSTQIVLFGKTIRVDAGNEKAVNKMTTNFSNLLLDPSKQSSGERLQCDPENQSIKETLEGETSEIEHSATTSKEVGGSKF